MVKIIWKLKTPTIDILFNKKYYAIWNDENFKKSIALISQYFYLDLV